MIKVSTLSFPIEYPNTSEALLVPSGYPQAPNAFDITATDVLNFFKNEKFDLTILSTPETFSVVELNSKIIRLGKFAVKDVAIPLFISLLANFIYENFSNKPVVDNNPIELTVSLEVCDSADMRVKKNIYFQGTPEQFKELQESIGEIIK